MAYTPSTPQDLVALAEDRRKKEREQKDSKEQTRLQEARQSFKAALPEGSWAALGIVPDAAEARDSGVFAEGTFSYADNEWACEAYTPGNQRDGVKLTVQLGNGFYLSEKLRSAYYSGESDAYQGENATAVGSLLADLPAQKALADEKQVAQEKERLDKVLSKAAYAFNTTYSAEYLRGNLARTDEFQTSFPEDAPQRERLEEMIYQAEQAAAEKEAEADEREKRAAEVLEKVKGVAAEQLAAVEDYDERCRRYAEEKAGAYFFGWTAQEIRYCPGFTAEAVSALAGSAAYYGGETGDEYAGAYDAVSNALVQKVVALNVRAAAEHEPGAYLFDRLGYNGTRTTLVIGALLDATELSFPAHDATESMAYHRSVPVGRFYVNVPGVQVGSKAIAERIVKGVPEQPTPFDERLREAGISEDYLELLPTEERNAFRCNAYRFLAGATDHVDPYYDLDTPF